MILFSQLPQLTKGSILQLSADHALRHFITDSRKAIHTDTSCFFAIKGDRNDGHQYIRSLYDAGVRMFVIERTVDVATYPEGNFFLCDSSLAALQHIAAHHRRQFAYPVIGITGSNAKTIVKEWIYQLLSPDYSIVKNPGSYNSQLGVPLSVLQMQDHHQLGVFEAGISQPGEMSKLAEIINPTIGIFTNIGPSHDAGFENRQQKVNEKLQLFSNAKVLIFCHDHEEIRLQASKLSQLQLISWGSSPDSTFQVVNNDDGTIVLSTNGSSHFFTSPFGDHASRENLLHCIVLMMHLGIAPGVIQERINTLKSVAMRLEVKQGVNQSLIIDDTYNNDLAGLQISLDFLSGQQKQKKTVILSDILQSGLSNDLLVKEIGRMVRASGANLLYAIGPVLSGNREQLKGIDTRFFQDTESFLREVDTDSFSNALVLIKGARPFRFEQIVQRLQRKIHGTVMEINLNALVHNLNYFKSRLDPGVKIMVMVKAFAYGSGSEEVANLLQYHKVDYLGVAYADEGVELRKNHITIPIMVMNPSEESFPVLIENNLEPEIYSIKVLKEFCKFIGLRPARIHIKFDTGMHRLGFEHNEVDELITILKSHPNLTVASAFSHLAGSDESEHDQFSARQVSTFESLYARLTSALQQQPIRHILNSPGILRFPKYQFDMVRLGIGLYGVDPTENGKHDLLPVATLKTVISQIKHIPKGETIGYGRKGKAESDMKLATIAIGYADGFSRSFSRGVGKVLVSGQRAPVVGNVCMDMTMIDITGIPAREGDEVIVFGQGLPIHEVASNIRTIPYEILTSTSERVKRVYHAESI